MHRALLYECVCFFFIFSLLYILVLSFIVDPFLHLSWFINPNFATEKSQKTKEKNNNAQKTNDNNNNNRDVDGIVFASLRSMCSFFFSFHFISFFFFFFVSSTKSAFCLPSLSLPKRLFMPEHPSRILRITFSSACNDNIDRDDDNEDYDKGI